MSILLESMAYWITLRDMNTKKDTMIVTAEIPKLTPEQLAECFWSLDDSEQARFFGSLGACALATPTWFGGDVGSYFPLDMQMYSASEKCTPNGLRVMEIIGQSSSQQRLQPYLEHWQTMPDVNAFKGRREPKREE